MRTLLAQLPRLALIALISLVAWGLVPVSVIQQQAWAQTPSPQTIEAGTSAQRAEAAGVPQKVFDVLTKIQARDGQPLLGYVGGRTFENRERRLPRGRYREYDVNPKVPGRNRGPERLVIEQRTGKAFYTGDHYRTFTPLN